MHRDGMWQLPLLLSSSPARRLVATVNGGHHAACLSSRESLHGTRGSSLSIARAVFALIDCSVEYVACGQIAG